MKKTLLTICIVPYLLLVGCTMQSQVSESQGDTLSQGIKEQPQEMITYTNKLYGYTVRVPKEWGAINSMDGSFHTFSEFGDDVETIGPNISFGESMRNEHFIYIEVFTKENAHKNAHESWIDYYKQFRLSKVSYKEEKMDDTSLEIRYDNDGSSGFVHRLVELNDKLYAFSYNQNIQINKQIIQSLSFQ